VIPEFVYRKVLLRGTWDHAHSMLIGPRVRDGTHGVHLITPLVRAGGSTILVDRGFLTKEQAEAAKARTDSGEVELVGMLRTTQARNAFTPDNDPERGVWYWADLDAMAAYAGGEAAGVQPVFVEAIFGMRPAGPSSLWTC
jgi:surfeit locus 1 family protein